MLTSVVFKSVVFFSINLLDISYFKVVLHGLYFCLRVVFFGSYMAVKDIWRKQNKNTQTYRLQSFRPMSISFKYVCKKKHQRQGSKKIFVKKSWATDFPTLEVFEKIKRVVNTILCGNTNWRDEACKSKTMLASASYLATWQPDKNCVVPLVHHWWVRMNVYSQSFNISPWNKITFQTIKVVFQPFFSGGLH